MMLLSSGTLQCKEQGANTEAKVTMGREENLQQRSVGKSVVNFPK